MREINGNEMQELRQRINGARPLKPLARVRYQDRVRNNGCVTNGAASNCTAGEKRKKIA